MALEYKEDLQKIDSRIHFLMTLYLSPTLTPNEIRKAKQAGIVGIKSYPRGVTTNSEGGIESYETYYPVFEAMQDVDMVLNLHGEVPSDAAKVRHQSLYSENHNSRTEIVEHPHIECRAHLSSSSHCYPRPIPEIADRP